MTCSPGIEPRPVLLLIYEYISANPGATARQVAEYLGLHRGSIAGLLAALEIPGYFLYEDDNGGLYTYSST